MSDQDQDQDQDGGDHESDDLNHEYSASNDDFPVSADESLANTRATNNNCPCLPTQQQKEISQALFKVPEGFQALLKHITRELLNAKPKDPYVYIADFLRSKVNDKRRGKNLRCIFTRGFYFHIKSGKFLLLINHSTISELI